METVKLKVEAREAGKGPAHRSREEGYVPAVLYGHGVKESLSIQVPAKELERAIAAGAGRHVIELTIGRKKYPVMIKDTQRNILKRYLTHVDFYVVSLKEKVHATVSLAIHGQEAVIKAGGLVDHHLYQVEVECLPGDMPDAIEVNVANLSVGTHISVADLQVPKGVKILTDPAEIVLIIDRPRTEAEQESAKTEKAEPELVKPKKAGEE